MCKSTWISIWGLVAVLVTASWAEGQSTPYIGFVYPAGGRQGTTVEVHLGGQLIDGLHSTLVSGEGVSAEVAHFYRKLSNQEMTLLKEQLKQLRGEVAEKKKAKEKIDQTTEEFIARLENRISHWVNRPACAALSSIAVLEVTIAPDAEPGAREIRLIGSRGVTNPMVFHVGQLREYARQPMVTSAVQVLGKEQLAQRKRPPEQVEERVELPCTLNGQIASGEVNRYRFDARRGQRLVISTKARELVPYIADAVPGWFQPIVAVHDSSGKEVAFNDDYRFKPDPTLFLEVPQDGEYVLTITDAIYRGREDFVYRITIGELPLVTSIFPLGGPAGKPVDINMTGWNLQQSKLSKPSRHALPGIYQVDATNKQGFATNTVPLALDTLRECLDQEPNNQPGQAQAVELPTIVNGRIDHPDDWDVFQIAGTAGDTIVAEVHARRLDSPLDSMLKVTDSAGQLLVFNDDHLDASSGLNTHHADSYVTITLPKDGKYFVHLGDTARDGGEAYAYRLRLSPPRPDFALRVVPSSINIRGRSGAAVTVYAIRRDGFDGPIRLAVEDLPKGLTSAPVTLQATEESARIVVKTKLRKMEQPIDLTVVGRAEIQNQQVIRPAVPAEDRMQAFLWRHLVPAENLVALVLDPSYRPTPKRPRPPKLELTELPSEPVNFSQQQVAGRLRQLGLLFDEWLLTDDFYNLKVAQCEVFEAANPLAKKKSN
jgi:hypothetical protein